METAHVSELHSSAPHRGTPHRGDPHRGAAFDGILLPAHEHVVRCLERRDLSAVAALWSEGDRVRAESRLETLRQYTAFKTTSGACALRHDGAVIGCTLLVAEVGARIGVISHVFVAPAHRRQGIATLLLNETERIARRLDISTLMLDVLESVPLALYRARGFVETGVMHEDGSFQMSKRLDRGGREALRRLDLREESLLFS